ncbi:hypothetical protein QBC35DRAFT_275227 [Podospora australis]|uniref:Uncharacterized protein n=1 Tax=Podospora australis TaxID=1536484 RepID=A0AAN6WQ47_9PEZI|nr:hypothetical protein QBC35DRAFT_275227 [Podospora australis]
MSFLDSGASAGRSRGAGYRSWQLLTIVGDFAWKRGCREHRKEGHERPSTRLRLCSVVAMCVNVVTLVVKSKMGKVDPSVIASVEVGVAVKSIPLGCLVRGDRKIWILNDLCVVKGSLQVCGEVRQAIAEKVVLVRLLVVVDMAGVDSRGLNLGNFFVEESQPAKVVKVEPVVRRELVAHSVEVVIVLFVEHIVGLKNLEIRLSTVVSEPSSG